MAVKLFSEIKTYMTDNLLNSIKIQVSKFVTLVTDLLDTIENKLDGVEGAYKGPASPSTNPGTPTARCYYLATGPGTYTYFGGLVVTEEYAKLDWTGSAWVLNEINIAADFTNYYTKVETDDHFLEVGKNLFNKDTINTGKYVESNGTLTTNANYNASDYIPVTAGESYWLNVTGANRRAYYNSSKAFLAGSYINDATRPYVAPAGAYYIRFSVASTVNLNTLQFEHGTVGTAYEAWALKFQTSKTNYKLPNDLDANGFKVTGAANAVDDGDLLPLSQHRSLTFEVGKNKFNIATINSGKYLDHTTGNLVTSGTNNATDYIVVLPETSYFINNAIGLRYAWYNALKVFISGSNVAANVITSPVGAAYLRYSVSGSFSATQQTEIGTVGTNYNPWIERIRNDRMEVYPTNFPDGFPYADYMVRDDIKHRIIVDKNGNGDYTTITAAYAAVIDSSFENQYEFIILPGTYNEGNLYCPRFTHTYALYPDSVKVVWGGIDTTPVFDSDGSCKLSNFTIVSNGNPSGYCIHYDARGEYAIRVFTNLTLVKLIGGGGSDSIIGGGAWDYYDPIWVNCKYASITGAPSCHTQTNSVLDRTKVSHINETLGDRQFALNNVGGQGYYNGEFINCKGTKGIVSLSGSVSANPPRTIANWWEYPANSWGWTITGSGNKDFCIRPVIGKGQALLFTALNYTDQFTISGTAVECLFGNYKYTKGGARIYAKLKGFWDVRDVLNGGTTNVIQMWKRLGDCSSVNKTLTVTIGATVQTYTFTLNYLTAQTAEATIIAAINAAITQVVLSKIDGGDNFDCIQTSEKAIVVCEVANSILKHEFLMISGTDYILATTNIEKYRVIGIAVNEAVTGELLEVWSGPIYISGLANGEYGIGAAGTLDITQSNKVGFVYNAIFYPYY